MRLLFILSLALLLLQSCDGWRKKEQRKYILENKTEHKIKIELFHFKHSSLSDTATISPGSKFERMSDDALGNHISARDALRSDSVIVLFDNNKRQIYTFSPIRIKPKHRNILVDSSYVRESDKLYRFTFTEEDYQNAEEL